MSEEAINIPMVVVGLLAIAAIIIGLIMAGVMPGINSAKKDRDLEMACTGYQAGFGCGNAACGQSYSDAACKTLLATAQLSVKDGVTDLWKICQEVGLADPRDCHIRCCGIAEGGKGGACKKGGVCDAGLRCVSKKCVAG